MPVVEKCINLQNRVWKRPNQFNKVLDVERAIWERIVSCGGLEVTVPFAKRRRYEVHPWEKQPPEGERLNKFFSIALPVTEGVDTLVGQFQMPLSWDGVVRNVMFAFTSPTWVPGSGDLTFRLKVGARWIPDFSAVVFPMENLAFPFADVGSYVRLLSLQFVSVYVNVAVGAHARLDPNGLVNSGLTGWTYPWR